MPVPTNSSTTKTSQTGSGGSNPPPRQQRKTSWGLVDVGRAPNTVSFNGQDVDILDFERGVATAQTTNRRGSPGTVTYSEILAALEAQVLAQLQARNAANTQNITGQNTLPEAGSQEGLAGTIGGLTLQGSQPSTTGGFTLQSVSQADEYERLAAEADARGDSASADYYLRLAEEARAAEAAEAGAADDGGAGRPGGVAAVGDTGNGNGGDDGTGEGGTGVDGGAGVDPGITHARAVAQLANLLDPAVFRTFIDNLTAAGLLLKEVFVDEDGSIVAIDSEDEEYRLSGEIAAGSSGITAAQLDFERRRTEISEREQAFSEQYRQDQLALNQQIADNEAAIARERLDLDRYIAEGQWENVIAVQDRIDERERAQRQLERDLANAQFKFQAQELDLQRAGFELEKLQFLTELSTKPSNYVDFWNISRGLPPVAGGGPLPGGLQQVVGQAQPQLPQLQFGAVQTPQVGPEGSVSQGTQALDLSASVDQQPVEATLEGSPGQAPAAAQPLNLGAGAQQAAPLPPAIAALLGGAQVSPLSLPQGALPILSQQQALQLGPSELEAYMALVGMQGIPQLDFQRLMQERAAPRRTVSTRSVA